MCNLRATVILLSGMLFSSVVRADIDLANWMAGLDDTALITQISIPGTHDSAADYGHCYQNINCRPIIEFVHTQTYEMSDQLDLGIRFLDMRLAYESHDLIFHHGPYDLGQSFGDTIYGAWEFVNNHPREFVIVLIKQEHTDVSTDSFWDRVHEILDNYIPDKDDLYFSQNGVPTVGEVRGKVVIMAREKPSDYPGSDPYHVEWSNNTVHYEGHDGHLKYVVEDHYSLNSVTNETKFGDVLMNLYLAALCEESCGCSETLFITFLSGEGDATGHGPYYFASYQNPHVAKWLNSRSVKRRGIVIMDFAGDPSYSGDDLIEAVIKQNKFN